jgi:hypothetical protein
LGAGVLAGLLLSGLIAAAAVTKVTLVPKPLCVAFMEAALHRPVTLAAGVAFNIVWVAFWSFFYVFLFWKGLPLAGAVGLAVTLWLLSMVFFFPAVGWGYFGMKLGARAGIDSMISYAVFAAVIWSLNRLLFHP